MPIADADQAVIKRYFRAMQAGRDGEADLIALFADDAVYIEPFDGDIRTHVGKAAIRSHLSASWEFAPPDLTLQVDRIDVDEGRLYSEWTCLSPALDAPVRGRDWYTLQNGKITRLEVQMRSAA